MYLYFLLHFPCCIGSEKFYIDNNGAEYVKLNIYSHNILTDTRWDQSDDKHLFNFCYREQKCPNVTGKLKYINFPFFSVPHNLTHQKSISTSHESTFRQATLESSVKVTKDICLK